MADKFAITGALNKIKQVMNHYKAFKDIEEALEVAAGVELVVSELRVEESRLHGVIDGLDVKRASLELDFDIANAEYAVKIEEGYKKLMDLEAAAANSIKEAAETVKRMGIEAAESLAAVNAEVEAARQELYQMRQQVAEAVDRYEDAKKALDDLRDRI
jgi:hypothetical protein